MFTLLVSWLLVACIPGLLMLAALGLGRLEKDLAHKSPTASDIDEFLEYADAVDMHTLAREGMPLALEYLHWRQAQQLAQLPPGGSYGGRHRAEPAFVVDFDDRRVADLPTRIHGHPRVNPQFRATKHVNHV
jgi:hypothetical protein